MTKQSSLPPECVVVEVLGGDAAPCRRWWRQGCQTCQAQLDPELTNVMMASPRSLQVSPLVCCPRAVPLCCSRALLLPSCHRAIKMDVVTTTTNATMDVGIATRKDRFPSIGRIHFYEVPTELGCLLREALWADASGLFWSGENTMAKRGLCTSDLDSGWTRRRGNTRRRKRGRARRWPASYLNGQNFNVGVEESVKFSVPK